VRITPYFLAGALAVVPLRLAASGYTISTLAGFAGGGSGSADGPAATARFSAPGAVATDGQGNVYVADTQNDTIRMITPAGVVSTIAGSPGVAAYADGVGAAARFNNPEALAVDGSGVIYVADTMNFLIRKITVSNGVGTVSTLAGIANNFGVGTGPALTTGIGQINGIAVDPAGDTIYFTEWDNSTVVQLTFSNGVGTISLVAGFNNFPGYMDGIGWMAQFSNPEGLVWAAPGLLYVADTGNSVIREISIAGGVATVSTVAGVAGTTGAMDGPGASALFNAPQAVAVDPAGNLYVADTSSDTIREITNPLTSPTVSTLAGLAWVPGYADNAGGLARFNLPGGVAVDGSGNVYVADTSNNLVRKIVGGVVTTFAGADGSGAMDGLGPAARFSGPAGVAVDGSGNLYVVDSQNDLIRMVTPGGVVTTLAGNAGVASEQDGPGATAYFDQPVGIAVNSAGTLAYVTDSASGYIRKLVISGGTATVSTVAGPINGGVYGITLDAAGDVFFTSTGLNAVFELPAAGGGVTFLAGNFNFPGWADGVGVFAQFNVPVGITCNPAGTILYVTDVGNYVVRKITLANGVATVTTIAGHVGVRNYQDGQGASAYFQVMWGIVLDGSGNVFVVDEGNDLIREISPGGNVSTLAGRPGVEGYLDGPGASAQFHTPLGIALDSSGNFYVGDYGNNAIRKGAGGGGNALSAPQITVQPVSQEVLDGTSPTFLVAATGNPAPTYQWELNGNPIPAATGSTYTVVSAQAGNAGSYTVVVTNSQGGSTSNPAILTVDSPPTLLLSPQNQSVPAGATVAFLVAANGSPAPTYQWYFNGVAINGQNQELLTLSNVTTAAAGTYSVQVANSIGSLSASAQLVVNGPPIVTSPTAAAAIAGSAFSYAITATGSVVTYGAAGLPAGLGINPATGAITGIPTVSGSFSVTVSATNAFGTGTAAVSLQIRPAIPVITSANHATGTVGSPFAYGIQVTGVPTGYSITGSLPGGLGFNAATGTIGGIPTQVGSFPVTLTASNQTGSNSLQVTIVIDRSSQPVNFSIRGLAGAGSHAMTVGFVLQGTGTTQTLIRAVGPTLASFGLPGALPDPALVIDNSSGGQVGANTGWGGTPALTAAFAAAGAFPLPANSRDSAFLGPFAPGSYTAQITGASGDSGIVLFEGFNLGGSTASVQIVNLSGLAQVGSGQDALLAGFVTPIGASQRFLIRGVGPTLGSFGLTGTLAAPVLTVFDGSSAVVATDSGWSNAPVMGPSSIQATVQPATAAIMGTAGAFALPPGSLDSALVVTLPPGSYTVQVAGANNSTGLALVEIYPIGP